MEFQFINQNLRQAAIEAGVDLTDHSAVMDWLYSDEADEA